MKQKIMIFFLGVISGCGNQKSSIGGRYVSTFQIENGTGSDTIVITPLNEKAHVYYFVHHIGTQKISKGNLVSEEHKTDSSLCTYNAGKEQLTDQIYGKVYTVSNTELKLISQEEIDVVYKRVR